MSVEVTPPTVHWNGTSQDALVEGYGKALAQLRAAQDAVAATAPHPRDFYVQADQSAYERARRQHCSRMDALDRVVNELEELGCDVIAQRRLTTRAS